MLPRLNVLVAFALIAAGVTLVGCSPKRPPDLSAGERMSVVRYVSDDADPDTQPSVALEIATLAKQYPEVAKPYVEYHLVRHLAKPYIGKGIVASDFMVLQQIAGRDSIPFLLLMLSSADDHDHQFGCANVIEQLTGYESWKLMATSKQGRMSAIKEFCEWYELKHGDFDR